MSDINGQNGSVTLPSRHGGQAFAFTVRSTQAKKQVNRYGDGRFVVKRGGLIEITGEVSVFMRRGATGTAVNSTTLSATGDSLVLTFDTGCTIGGTALFDFNATHRFDDPANEATYPFEFTGTVTEAWATA
jgi:hypothetical protein